MNYPTFESLGTDPDYLWIGTHEELQARGAAAAPQPRVTASEERSHKAGGKVSTPRLFKSRYVGVMEHRGRWISQWEIGDARFTSTVYEHTPIGAWQAAYARMRALGRDLHRTPT